MSKIRGKDTSIELAVSSYLHRKGYRFRRNVKGIPGSPDIAIKKYKVAIFVNGCFWHGHEGCPMYSKPKSNTAFWNEKIQRNKERDKRNIEKLKEQDWNVKIIWECELNKSYEATMNDVESWLCDIVHK